MTRSDYFPSVTKQGRKIASALLLVALVGFGVGFSAPQYFSANAASWMDKVFGNTRVQTRPRYRRSKPRQIRQVRQRVYAIGRIDQQLRPVRKKRRTYQIPKKRSAVYSSRAKTYRTMCVRTCDGFFFPVSFATGKNRLKKDERVCKSSCGAPAQLYYYPNPGGEIEDMVSYRGKKKYKKLKYAFLYKTKFVPSCRCKPEPWTQAAKQKHEKYASIELKQRAKIAARKKARKRRVTRKRAKSRRKGRRYSRRSSRNKRKALRVGRYRERTQRRNPSKRTYRNRKKRRASNWTF